MYENAFLNIHAQRQPITVKSLKELCAIIVLINDCVLQLSLPIATFMASYTQLCVRLQHQVAAMKISDIGNVSFVPSYSFRFKYKRLHACLPDDWSPIFIP